MLTITDWCGTPHGYVVHIKNHTEPCTSCRDARRDYQRSRRFRAGAQHRPYMCRDCGSVFPDHRCHLTAE